MSLHKRVPSILASLSFLESISPFSREKREKKEKHTGRGTSVGKKKRRRETEMAQKRSGQFAKMLGREKERERERERDRKPGGAQCSPWFSNEKISSFPRRISDCLRRVIRRHQTSRSSSGIVYLATSPPGCAPSWVAQGRPLSLSQQ